MAERTDILDKVLTRDEVTDVLRLLGQEGIWPNAEYTVQDVVDGTHEEPSRVYQALMAVRDPSSAAAEEALSALQVKAIVDSDSLTPDEVKQVRRWIARLEFQWKLGWLMFALVGVPLLLVALAKLSQK